jgi:hypothetical protein
VIDDIAAPVPATEAFARPVGARTAHGRHWLTALLALAVLVASGGLALLYNDEQSLQAANHALTTDNESLQGMNLGLQAQLAQMQTSLAALQSSLTSLQAEVAHPHLGIWNVRQSLADNTEYLAAGVPDTFTYHLVLKSTGQVNVSIITLDQFAAAIKCVENGVGPTNYCMHHSGAVNSWLGVTSVDSDFHLAEGCAGYVLVVTAPNKVTVTPDISVTYNPAPHATGTCT